MKRCALIWLLCLIFWLAAFRADAGENFICPQRVFPLDVFTKVEAYDPPVRDFSDRLYGVKPIVFHKIKPCSFVTRPEGPIYSLDADSRTAVKLEEPPLRSRISLSYESADQTECYSFSSFVPLDLLHENYGRAPMSADGRLIVALDCGGKTTEQGFSVGELFGRTAYLEAVRISNTGKYLILRSGGGETALINLQNLTAVDLKIKKYVEDISPDDRLLFVHVYTHSESPDDPPEVCYIVDIETGGATALETKITGSIFSEDCGYVLGYDAGYSACILDVNSGKLVKRLKGVTVSRTGTKFSMEQDVILTFCSDIISQKLRNPFVNEGTFIEKHRVSTGEPTLYEIPQRFFGSDIWVWDSRLERVYTIDRGNLVYFPLPR